MNTEEQLDQMEAEAEVESMNITIQQAQRHVQLGDALIRLQENPDFKLLIMGDYLNDQTARLGHLLSDPTMQSKKQRRAIIKEIEAIGLLLSFLQHTDRKAAMAKESIHVNEAEIQAMNEAQAEAANQG